MTEEKRKEIANLISKVKNTTLKYTAKEVMNLEMNNEEAIEFIQILNNVIKEDEGLENFKSRYNFMVLLCLVGLLLKVKNDGE